MYVVGLTGLGAVRKKKKPLIVTDTNIWYTIAGGEWNVVGICQYGHLRPTYLNMFELASSHKLYRSPLDVKEASKELLANGCIRLSDPFGHLVSLDSGTHDDSAGESLKRLLTDFAEMSDEGVELQRERLRGHLPDNVADFREATRTAAAAISDDILPKLRAANNYKGSSDERTAANALAIKNLLRQWVLMGTGRSLSQSFDWKKCELLVDVGARFFAELERTSNMRVHENDLIDLLNLSYVQPGAKYWTLETKWLRLIKDAGRAEYLFDPSPRL